MSRWSGLSPAEAGVTLFEELEMNKTIPDAVLAAEESAPCDGVLVAGTGCAALVTAVNELEDADALALSVCPLSLTVCRGYDVDKLRVSKNRDE